MRIAPKMSEQDDQGSELWELEELQQLGSLRPVQGHTRNSYNPSSSSNPLLYFDSPSWQDQTASLDLPLPPIFQMSPPRNISYCINSDNLFRYLEAEGRRAQVISSNEMKPVSLGEEVVKCIELLIRGVNIVQALSCAAKSWEIEGMKTMQDWLYALACGNDCALDKFAAEVHERQLEKQNRSTNKFFYLVPHFFHIGIAVVCHHEMADKVDNMNSTFVEIYEEVQYVRLGALEVENYIVEIKKIKQSHPFNLLLKTPMFPMTQLEGATKFHIGFKEFIDQDVDVLFEVYWTSMLKIFNLSLQGIQIPLSAPQLVALPIGGEMLQLDSVETSLVEFDVTNNGAHIVREDQSCSTLLYDSEKKYSSDTSGRKQRTKDEISLKDLEKYFDIPRAEAANSLRVSVSTLKRVCRKYGILRWPNKKKKKGSEPTTEPQGEKIMSPTCETPLTSGQAEIGNEMRGHYQEQSHDSCPGNYPPAMDLSISSTSKESGEAGGPSELVLVVEELTPSAACPNPSVPMFTQAPIASTEMTTIHPIMSHFAARQDTRIVRFRAAYEDVNIQFELSPTFRIVDLKKEVAKRLELELGNFIVEYQAEDREWLLIACDADLQDCLTCLSSSSCGNQVIRARVRDKFANSKDSRRSCKGKKRKSS